MFWMFFLKGLFRNITVFLKIIFCFCLFYSLLIYEKKKKWWNRQILAIISITSFWSFRNQTQLNHCMCELLYTCYKHWCLEFNTCQNSLCLITKVTANNLRLLETGNECTDRISWEILGHVDLNLWPLQEFGESKNVII